MDILFFLVKYTPFWAIPSMMIAVFFAYIYWLKDVSLIAFTLAAYSVFCFVATILYIWIGGPQKCVDLIYLIIKNY